MQLVRFRVDLGPRCSLGPGKIALLEAIADRHRCTARGRKLGMSYRYAWLLLEDLKRSFVEPVTRARRRAPRRRRQRRDSVPNW